MRTSSCPSIDGFRIYEDFCFTEFPCLTKLYHWQRNEMQRNPPAGQCQLAEKTSTTLSLTVTLSESRLLSGEGCLLPGFS
jgi:hypothetical protein